MTNATRIFPVLFAATVIALAFAGGMWLSIKHGDSGNGAHIDGLLWPDPPVVQPFNLYDHEGRPFTLEQLRARWSLVFFGFTHCPDICPTTLDAMAKAHRQLQSNPSYAAHGQVIFISVDPERDVPATLASYVHYFSPQFVGASGGVEELRALTRSLGALFMRVDQGADAYTMDHSAGIFFIDPQLRLVSVLTPPHNAAAIATRFDAVSAFMERL